VKSVVNMFVWKEKEKEKENKSEGNTRFIPNTES
jgi:hypothetical protein